MVGILTPVIKEGQNMMSKLIVTAIILLTAASAYADGVQWDGKLAENALVCSSEKALAKAKGRNRDCWKLERGNYIPPGQKKGNLLFVPVTIREHGSDGRVYVCLYNILDARDRGDGEMMYRYKTSYAWTHLSSIVPIEDKKK
jgi:hypothetical protein